MQIDVRSGRLNVFRQQRYFFRASHKIGCFYIFGDETNAIWYHWSKLDRTLEIISKVARFVNSLGECFDGRVEFEICLLNEPRGRALKRMSCSSLDMTIYVNNYEERDAIDIQMRYYWSQTVMLLWKWGVIHVYKLSHLISLTILKCRWKVFFIHSNFFVRGIFLAVNTGSYWYKRE